MKDIVIALLVVALGLLVVGAASQNVHVDIDYVFGTWHNVSLLVVFGGGAAFVFGAGIISASYARMRLVGDRRKLEKELEQVYGRLRAAEAQAGVAEPPSLEAVAADATAVEVGGSDDSVTAETATAEPAASTLAAEAESRAPTVDGTPADAGDLASQ